VAVTLAATLAGCAPQDAGAAAVVNQRRISVADVQQATEQIQVLVGGPVAQADVLYYLIIGPFLIDGADRAGVGVAVDDARAELQKKVAHPGAAAVTALQANEASVRIQSLGEVKGKAIVDAVAAEVRAADIRVSPRYGSFDAQSLQMGQDEANWYQGGSGS
jgi:hypothetical protein